MAFDLGAVYPAAIEVTDASGAFANCDTISLKIGLPDGTFANPAIMNPPTLTGRYGYPYVTVQSGRHTARWVGTNPNIAFTDAFDVKEADPPSILSLVSAKKCLGMDPDNTEDDDELRDMLAGITASVELYMHQAIVVRTVTEKHSRSSFSWTMMTPRLRLHTIPVLSLQSITSQDTNTSWDPANLDVDSNTGLVRVLRGPDIIGNVVSVYTVGMRMIPYNYLEGSKVLLQHLWETRRGPGGESGVIGPEELADFRHYTAWPRKAQEWFGQPMPVVL